MQEISVPSGAIFIFMILFLTVSGFFLKKHITFQLFCNQIVSCNCQIWENYILSGVFLYLHACLVLVKCNLESPEISIVLVVYMLERMVQGLRPESSAVSVC